MSLQDQILQMFAEKMNCRIPSPEVDLFETGILDSMAFVELLLHLEDQFATKISVDDLEFENFRSVTRIADFVLSNRAKAASDDRSDTPDEDMIDDLFYRAARLGKRV